MTGRTVTPAERIHELSAINAEVARMLQSASYAITSLTIRPQQPASSEEDADKDTEMTDGGATSAMDTKKAAFVQHTEAYYAALQSVVARLRRQAYALEEAGIIAPEASLAAAPTLPPQKSTAALTAGSRGPPVTSSSQQATDRTAQYGHLDAGWLNSRGNKVGVEKDAELIQETRNLLEGVISRSDAGAHGV